MAAEKTNEKLAHLGDTCHPAFLRQLRSVIRSAHSERILIDLFGEQAGDLGAIQILLGPGLDWFSMSPVLISHTKTILRGLSKANISETRRRGF